MRCREPLFPAASSLPLVPTVWRFILFCRVVRLVELAALSLQAGGPSAPPTPMLRCAAADFAFRLASCGRGAGLTGAAAEPPRAGPSPSVAANAWGSSRPGGGGTLASELSFFEDVPYLVELLLGLCTDSWPQVRLLAASHLHQLSERTSADGPGERARLAARVSEIMLLSLRTAADTAAAVASGSARADSGAGAGREALLVQKLRIARGAWQVRIDTFSYAKEVS